MGRFRRIAVGVLGTLVISGFLVMAAESPADARKVGNPGGGFTLKVHAGAMSIGDNDFDFVDEGRVPQCSDGSNNDGAQDGSVDFPADGQCTSATDDSETAGGFQPKQPIQMTNGTIAANGDFTFPAANVSFPPQYLFVEAPSPVGNFVVTINITANSTVTGNINPSTGAMTINMNVRVGATGGPLASGCQVNPIVIANATTGSMPAIGSNPAVAGSPYNQTTGRMTLVHNAFSVPGASNCGTYAVFVDLNDQINSQLGLPSPAGENTASFLSEWIPKPTPGVVPSFTTTPSSGAAPLAVSFNASGSTGVGLTYGWDFTNNGTIDASGVTANSVYAAPGSYTARLRVTDSDGDFAETTRTITVGANLAPTANDATVNVGEDAVNHPITLAGSDPEGGALTFTRVSPNPTHGTVSCTGAACTYTPVANYNGPDSFGFRVTDPVNQSDDGVISINVTPVNDAPVAANVTATVNEDGSGPVTMSASDVEGSTLTYTVLSGPSNGSLTGTGATRTYAPAANFNGTDSFTYRANDGTANSNVATATITVTSVNDQPTASDLTVSVPEDGSAGVTLAGSDPDLTPLAFSLVDPPDHGTLTGSLPHLTYTPAPNYNGPDAFTYKVTDPGLASDNGQVDIAVTSVNDAPTTSDLSVTTDEDTPITVTIPGSDIDAEDSLTFTPSSPTAGGGAVSCAADECTYTPATGFAGFDSFTVQVSDGEASATSTVSVTVEAFNNAAPTIDDGTVVGLEGMTRSFSVVSADVDGDPLTHSVVSQPTTGTLTCDAAGSCTFVPAADAFGTSVAEVQVSDGRGGVATAHITVIVVNVNDAPSVPAQSVVTDEDTASAFDLAGDDVDDDTLAWSVKQAPTKGTLSCTAAGACTYTPSPDANGSDSAQVEADDGHGSRVRITIPITIAPVNDPPVATTVTRTVNEDGSVSFSLPSSDPDGDAVTFAASPAVNGALSCSAAGACTYAPNANANGTDTILYTASDGDATSTGNIAITIVPVNDPPAAVSQTRTTPEDTAVGVTLTAADPDPGDALAYELLSAPGQGTLGGLAPDLTYTPAPNANGSMSLSFRVRDAAGATSTATITIVVTPVDDAPVPGNPSVTTAEDTAGSITLTGTDAEGPVTFAVLTSPSNGTLTGSGATRTYTPAANYNGADSFTYRVTSNTGQTAEGIVGITVTPVNDAPVALDGSVSTTRTVAVPITLAATDVDGDALTYTVLTGPTKGTITGAAPNLVYTPGLTTGSDNLTFRVTDASGVVDSGTIAISITGGPALITQLVLSPATVIRDTGPLGFLVQNTYSNLKGTLTTPGGLPISGKVVKFSVNGKQICQATTNSSGVATCGGKGPNVAATAYSGAFAGDTGFAGSTGTGTLS